MPAWQILVGSAAISCVATYASRRLALSIGWLDRPTDRGSHRTATPRTGGIGIVLGLLPTALATQRGEIAIGALLFFVVGLCDDVTRHLGGLRSWSKMLLQLLAAYLPVRFGAVFEGAPSGPFGRIDLGAMAPFLTVLWFVAVVNVINFMDGIDAITSATSLAILTAVALVLAPESADLYWAGAGAVVGFAVWNVSSSRKVFPGDSGSHLLGFLIASTACSTPLREGGVAHGAPWALVAAPLVPSIVDVVEALIHKRRHGIPMAQPHNDHLYQRLTKAGWSHVAVAIRYGLLAAAACALVGPVAERWGLWAALVPGAAILGLHLWTGARATRGIPRLGAPPAPATAAAAADGAGRP